MITNILYPSENCRHVAKRLHDHCAIALGLPQDDRPMSVRFYGPCKDIVLQTYNYRKSVRSFLSQNFQSKIVRCPHDHLAVAVRASYHVTAMCLRATAYDFFQICHCAELNKIVEATMPVKPYDDRKVFLRRPHGNGDLDIVRASYTRHKANVTEALAILIGLENQISVFLRMAVLHRFYFTV